MRPIDADALKKSVPNTHVDIFENCRNCELLDDEQVEELIDNAPTIDAVPVVRCKDCKWYDPPHIDHNDGTRTDVEDDASFVPSSVGINVGGKCMNTLREYCCNHDREDPDDYERLVKFRNRMDYCSDGERKAEK